MGESAWEWPRRERAYEAAVWVSLAVVGMCLSSLSTAIPLLFSLTHSINTQLEVDAIHCQELVFETKALSLRSASSRNISRPGRYAEEDENCPFVFENERKYSRGKPRCEFPRGPPGLPGRDGLSGLTGTPGAPGKPARLPCDPPIDYAKYCPDSCPTGVQGKSGPMGLPGDKGDRGEKGNPGKHGEDGKKGPKGDLGARGVPGLDGLIGDPGEDAMPSPFIPGPPGEPGNSGARGPIGPIGMPGIDGPRGTSGLRGPKGQNGLPGAKGEPGIVGPIGEPGDEGEKGVCPTYCATDGGVFFVEPPEWFFRDE